jgi:uncharacterized protein (DUF58 family)
MADERDGLELLRETIEEVAVEVESGPRKSSSPRRALVGLLAAAALLIALLASLQIMRAPRSAEVEVLALKINGRPVRARIVEDASPSTIIIVPQRNEAPAATATAILLGGAK